ncbi:MAG: sensor histidine kinase [Solirubrobacteraceae bacterium]
MTRLRRPQTTVRWRLALLYGGMFLISGAALLAITYSLVDHAPISSEPRFVQVGFTGPAGRTGVTPSELQSRNLSIASPPQIGRLTLHGAGASVPVPNWLPARVKALLVSHDGRTVTRVVVAAQRISDLHQLVVESAIALAIMALISAALGWVIAGRVLRPLRTITATTRGISEQNLHRRLAMAGPRDELRLLADTIDGLLERLEAAFEAQRRFVANASHELRTPLTAVRALLEMAIADPHADIDMFRDTCSQVLDESTQQERLIDALLALAHGQRGIDVRRPVDLGALVAAALPAREAEAAARGLTMRTEIRPALVAGDEPLLERLTCNLLDNALRHNATGGSVQVTVAGDESEVTLRVVNTGPPVAVDDVPRLLAPFQRLTRERLGHGEGFGLGLSIVAAVAAAHGAGLNVTPREAGGLEVEVRFTACAVPAPASEMAPSDMATHPEAGPAAA